LRLSIIDVALSGLALLKIIFVGRMPYATDSRLTALLKQRQKYHKTK
jgi:hypothetical protein